MKCLCCGGEADEFCINCDGPICYSCSDEEDGASLCKYCQNQSCDHGDDEDDYDE